MAYLGKSVDQPCFFGASPEIRERAKALRKRMTFCEKVLWQVLRKNRLRYFYFRRQHPISRFIVDFYCHELRLVIEIDGEYHASAEQQEKDINRSAELENFELKILRFTNQEVLENIRKVERRIYEVMTQACRPRPIPPPRGREISLALRNRR